MSVARGAERVTLFVDGIDLGPTAAALGFEVAGGLVGGALGGGVAGLPGKVVGGAAGKAVGDAFHQTAPIRQASYLAESQLGFLLKKESIAWESVQWNGDLQDETSLRTAKDSLGALILKYSRDGKQVDVVTHSMGSVVAYLTLKELALRSDRPVLISNLVTLSSPLGQSKFLVRIGNQIKWVSPVTPGLPIEKSADLIPPDGLRIGGQWFNAFVMDDPVGGPVFGRPSAKFINYVVPNDRYKFDAITVTGGTKEYSIKTNPFDFYWGVSVVHSLPYRDALTTNRIVAALKASSPTSESPESGTEPGSQAGGSNSRDALLAEFREPNGSSEVIRNGAKFSIELCDQDGICSYYEGRATKSEAEVWDLGFLQSYYVEEGSDSFKAGNKDVASALLAQYAALCPTSPDSAVAARCIVDRLSKRNGVRMGGVRYDEGHRCVVWTDREFDPDRDCKPY